MKFLIDLLNDLHEGKKLTKYEVRRRIGASYMRFLTDIGLLVKDEREVSVNIEMLNQGIIYKVVKEVKVDSLGNKESITKVFSLKDTKMVMEKKKESFPLFYPLNLQESLRRFNSRRSYAGAFVPYAYSLSIRVRLSFTPKEVFVFHSEKAKDDETPLDPVPIGEPRAHDSRTFYYNFRMVRRGGYFIGWVPPDS